jgi:hypothetical protein
VLCPAVTCFALPCRAVQHPPVYTMGAGSSEDHVKFDLQHPPHPLYRTERGGEVTFHGPGQVGAFLHDQGMSMSSSVNSMAG